MKKILSMIVTAAMVMALFSGTAFAGNGNGHSNGNGNGYGNNKQQQKEFKDMKGHWGYQSVQKMQNYGIFGGYSDDTFRPDQALSEAELAVIIERLVDYIQDSDDDSDQIAMNFLSTGNNGIGWGSGYNWGSWGDWGSWNNPYFSNVPGWAQKSVWRGVYNNYFNPYSFNPNTQASRVTAIVAIAKALDLDPEPVYTYDPFSDGKLIANEDLGYVLAMYKEGYISGNPDGSFNPNAALTRAQMATIIEKLLDKYEDSGSDDDNAPTWDNDSTVKATAIKATSVDLKWTAAEDDEEVTGYKVFYKVDGDQKSKAATGRTITISGLEPDEEYTFTVEAKDAAGNWSDDGPSVEVTTAEEDDTDTEDSEEPTWDDDSTVTATAIRATSVDLKWDAADDNDEIAGYKVSYKVDGEQKTKSVSGKTVTISGLEPDEEYTFTVKAKDAAGNWSDDSLSVTVTTLEEESDDTAPTWPDGESLTVSSSSSGVVTLIWPDAEDNEGVESYKIYQDGEQIKTLDGDKNSYNVSGLKEGTKYTFKVKAIDEAGNQSISLVRSYTAQ